MNKKWSDFIFSFGFMIVGVVFLFFGTLTAHTDSFKKIVAKWPGPAKSDIPVAGGDVAPNVLPVSRPAVPLSINSASFNGQLTAGAAIVVDDKTNTVLFKKNIEEMRPLASITKLITALVLNDMPLNWSATATVLAEDIESGNHVEEGEEYTLEDLWHIALIGSSNSAVKTLVRVSGLSAGEFVDQMNRKVADLNLFSLHFTEPTGLESGNIGNALAAARLLKEAVKVERIFNTLQIGEYYAHPINQKPRRVWSTNWLLTDWISSNFSHDEIVGKTGYITEAGYNFVVRLADKNGHAIRVAIFGSSSNESRFTEARDLGQWVFANFLWPDQEGFDTLFQK